MQGIFMGTAYKSIVEELKKQLTKLSEHITMYQALQLVRLFEQMNKETEYDPEEKYGGSYDAELAELINKKIESGEYKVERPKVDNEN
jgi:anti-sigma28 factor (negative regulator of flagellin synthesis)